MIYLLFLFIISQVGIGLRYAVYGLFEWNQFFMSVLFLAGAFAIFWVSRQQSRRDFSFQPEDAEGLWQTRLASRFRATPKKLANGSRTIYTYHRFFPKLWQRIFVELLNEPDFYVHLRFQSSKNLFEWRELPAPFTQKRRDWKLFSNGQPIASAHYVPSLKSAMMFENRLYVEVEEEHYRITGYKGASQIILAQDGRTIGEGDLSKLVNGHYWFRLPPDSEEAVLAMAMTLFFFVHK